MSGPGVPSCLLLLAALSSAAVTNGGAKVDATKTVEKVDTTKTSPVAQNKDLTPQESKTVRSQPPTKRHIRKFDFDAEFATYLGLASQADTARYLAGDADSSYKAPPAFQEGPDGTLNPPPLRLIPGSTPASFAYFTQIYPAEHSDGDIRVEHFSPVIHPFSSDREKARYRDDDEEPEPYERPNSNYYPGDVPLYAPPTSRSYYGRYSNKQKYSESSEDNDGPKPSKLQALKQPTRPSKEFDDDPTPDYKMGYRHVGMYHKFHEEDLYPKKTSSEWIPLKQSSKSRNKHNEDADRGTNYDEPGNYHDAQVSLEDFHVRSEHDDEITRIKTNIENDPPYSTNNFDLAEKVPSIGKLNTKGTAHRGADEYGKGYSPADPLAEPPFEPAQRVRKHKRRRKKKRKHHRHHQHGRPAYLSSPIVEASVPFTNSGQNSGYKGPSFEFHNPVNSYVSPPYTPPETHKSNLKVEAYKNHESHDTPKELYRTPSAPSAPSAPSGPSESPEPLLALEPLVPLEPSAPFQVESENDLPLTGEAEKDVSLEEPADASEEPADVDYGPIKLDDLDEDYHIISEAGPREHAEHTKDFDKRLPQDDKVYGSFETFDSQLDREASKKFEPFVQYPFEEQRKKLATVVQELIASEESRHRKKIGK